MEKENICLNVNTFDCHDNNNLFKFQPVWKTTFKRAIEAKLTIWKTENKDNDEPNTCCWRLPSRSRNLCLHTLVGYSIDKTADSTAVCNTPWHKAWSCVILGELVCAQGGVIRVFLKKNEVYKENHMKIITFLKRKQYCTKKKKEKTHNQSIPNGLFQPLQHIFVMTPLLTVTGKLNL